MLGVGFCEPRDKLRLIARFVNGYILFRCLATDYDSQINARDLVSEQRWGKVVETRLRTGIRRGTPVPFDHAGQECRAYRPISPDSISRDPNRVITPGFRVNAVVHCPWGGHPSPVPGYYNRDHQAFIDYRNESKTAKLFSDWRKRWIDDIADRQDYLDMLGPERITALAIKKHVFSEAVDYGY